MGVLDKAMRFMRMGPTPVHGKQTPASPSSSSSSPSTTTQPAGSQKKHASTAASLPPATKASANPLKDLSLEAFIAKQTPTAWTRLLANIHPAGTLPGCVVASPSKALPDYWYEWTRDSAICERALVERFVRESRPDDLSTLEEYVEASRIMQHKQTLLGGFNDGGLGEVKYEGKSHPSPSLSRCSATDAPPPRSQSTTSRSRATGVVLKPTVRVRASSRSAPSRSTSSTAATAPRSSTSRRRSTRARPRAASARACSSATWSTS